MRFHRFEIEIRTERRFQIVDITDDVRRAVGKSGIRNGIALVFPEKLVESGVGNLGVVERVVAVVVVVNPLPEILNSFA